MASAGVVVAVFLAAAVLFSMAEAADFQVGDGQGWQPPSDSSFYSTWANGKTFAIGDTLTFNFATGLHDVAVVAKAEYDACNVAAANNVMNTGPTTVTLNSTGMQYFFCTFSNHCSRGQKLAVNVDGGGGGGSSGSPTTPSSGGGSPPSTGGSGSPPSPATPSSAESFAASFVLILISLAVGAVVWF
ncbi:unnamed protein product [Linum trigynum]|uniref:Phytocyanin domain-containing protein n=1 Tax=Linum trigynum TaxID=586398 RepID=A0AAV2CT35_9ROSI